IRGDLRLWISRGRCPARCAGSGRSCRLLLDLLQLAGLQRELVGDRGAHPQAGVAPVVVVLLDPCRDPLAGVGLGGEVLELRQLSMTALSSAEPTLPMDWVTPTRPQAAWKFFAVYSLD